MASMEQTVERLCGTVEQMSQTVGELVTELRTTNNSIQRQTLDIARLDMTVTGHQREIYTADNLSRIRALELHVKGLYALCVFIATVLGGQLAAILAHWQTLVGK